MQQEGTVAVVTRRTHEKIARGPVGVLLLPQNFEEAIAFRIARPALDAHVHGRAGRAVMSTANAVKVSGRAFAERCPPANGAAPRTRAQVMENGG